MHEIKYTEGSKPVLGIKVTLDDIVNYEKNIDHLDHHNGHVKSGIKERLKEYTSFGSYSSKWARDPSERAVTREAIDNRLRGIGDAKVAAMIKNASPKIADGITFESLNELELEAGLLCGEEIDFDAYQRGDARCLGRWNCNVTEDGDRVVKIVIGMGGNCLMKPEDLASMAANGFALGRKYEEAGYSVEWSCFIANKRDGLNGREVISVVLFDVGRATIGQVEAMIASPMMFRVFGFAQQDFITGIKYDSGYGYPINHKQNPESMPLVSDALLYWCGKDSVVIHVGASERSISEALRSERKVA